MPIGRLPKEAPEKGTKGSGNEATCNCTPLGNPQLGTPFSQRTFTPHRENLRAHSINGQFYTRTLGKRVFRTQHQRGLSSHRGPHIPITQERATQKNTPRRLRHDANQSERGGAAMQQGRKGERHQNKHTTPRPVPAKGGTRQ